MRPVTALFPPPPRHPKTHQRLTGMWMPTHLTARSYDTGTRTRLKDKPLVEQMHRAMETALTAGWTCGVIRLTGKIRPPALPLTPPMPLIFEMPPRSARSSYLRLITCISVWKPLAVLSAARPPDTVYERTPHVWRIRETLPLSDAPDLFALTSPDTRALGDPRLHCWLVPPEMTPDDLDAWREVLSERPEVPVLFMSRWEQWGRALHSRLRLMSALEVSGGERQESEGPPRSRRTTRELWPLFTVAKMGG